MRLIARALVRCSLLPAVALLAACAHAPDSGDVPPGASFEANILTDGTKLFVYAVRRGGAGDRESAGDGGPRPQQASTRGAQNMKRGLEGMLAQNHYCRDGYLVLEQYDDRTGSVIRGECREAATAHDRELFPRSHVDSRHEL